MPPDIHEEIEALAHHYAQKIVQKNSAAQQSVFSEPEEEPQVYETIKDLSGKTVWSLYTMLKRVEESFRCVKDDLNMRPVFHRKKKPYGQPSLYNRPRISFTQCNPDKTSRNRY